MYTCTGVADECFFVFFLRYLSHCAVQNQNTDGIKIIIFQEEQKRIQRQNTV